MECIPKDKNNLGYYLNSIYVITEQYRYGESKRASSISVSGKRKTQFKAVYEKTLENIDNIQRKFQKLKDVENESKSLRWKYDNLVVEKDKDRGRLRQLYEDSQKKQEGYKNKARDLMEENLALKRRNEDLEANLNDVDYANLSHQLQDCLRKSEEYKNKAKYLLFSKQELDKKSQEQVQQALQENNNLKTQLKELGKENREKVLELTKQLDKFNEERAILHDDCRKIQHQNNKNQDITEEKNEDIAQMKNPLMQNEKKKDQLQLKMEIYKEISAKPALLSLQIDDNIARQTHSNLLQSASDNQTCINCRKLQNELKNKVEEINNLRIDETDFKNTGYKERSSSLEYITDSYLKQQNELESRNKELQSKNQKLADNLRSVQNDLYEYRNSFGKPTYADLWKMHEENKQRLNKSEENVKIIESTSKETQQKYSNLQENIVKLKEENEEKIKHHQKIQAEYEKNQITLGKIYKNLTEYKQREENSKKTEAVLRKMCEENNQQLTKKEVTLKKIEATLEETQERYLLLQKDNEKLIKENEDGRHVKDLFKTTEVSLKETQQNYLSLQENYEKFTKENEELKKEIEESFDVRSKIEMELESMHKTFQDTHNDLIQQKQKKEILKKTELEIIDLQEKYSNLEEKNRQLIKINDDNLEDLLQFQTKYEDIQAELKTVRNEFEEYKRINKEKKKKEERKHKEEDQMKENQHSEREENIKILETILKERESAFKVKEEHLQKILSDLKYQKETLQNQLVKINQRETELNAKLKNILERETRIKEEEIAYHTKEENLKKIEEIFEKSKTELTVQITNLNEKYIILQQEKEEAGKTYQHLLKQFVQVQEELKKNKNTLESLREVKQNEERKKYFEEEEVLTQQSNLLQTKLPKYEHREKEQNYMQIAELCQIRQRLQEEIKELKQKLDESEKLLNKKMQQTEKAAEERKTAIEKCNYLEGHLKSLFEEKEDSLKKMTTLQSQVSFLKNQNNVLLKKKEDVEHELSSIQEVLKKKNELTEEVSELKIRIENLLEERREYFDLKEEFLQKYEVLRKENEQICGKLNTTESAVQVSEVAKAKLLQDSQSLKKELEEGVKKNSDLTREIAKINQDCSALKQEVGNLRNVYEEKIRKLEDFKKEESELNNEISSLKKGEKKFEREMRNIIQQLEEQIQEKDSIIENLNKLIREVETELKNKQKSKDEMRKLLICLEESEARYKAKENIFIKKEKDWDNTESNLNKQLSRTKQEATKTDQENKDLLRECETLKHELKNAQLLHEKHRQEIEENFRNEENNLKNELASLKDDNKKLENHLDVILQKNLKLENEIQVIKTDLNQYKNETAKRTYEELSTSLAQLEEQLKEKNANLKSKEELLKEAKRKLEETDVLVEKTKTELQEDKLILKQKNAELKGKVLQTSQENKLLKEELETKRIGFENQCRKNEDDFKKETQNLSNALSSLNDRNQKLEDDLNDALQKRSKLEDEFQVITNELDRYKSKPSYEEVTEKLAQLETQLTENSAVLQNKNQLIEKAEIQAKNKEMEFIRQLKEISNAKTTENNASIERVKTEFNNMIKDYVTIETNLKESVSILKRENTDIMEKEKKINQECNELRQEQDILKLELNNKKNVYDQQRQEFEEISRKEANDLKNEISSLQSKNQKLQNEIETSTDKCLKLENETAGIQNELRSTMKSNYEQLQEKDTLLEKREKLIEERKTQNEELRKEIIILKQTNVILIIERDTAINERIHLLEEYESLKRELEAREIVYEEELNRYEETFRKEENDLRSRVSVLKRENGILQREIDHVLEEKHRVEELTHITQNNMVEEIAQMGKQLEEKNATFIKDLNDSSKKQSKEFKRLISVKEEENRKLDKQIQEMNEILQNKEIECKNKMEIFKNEMSSLLSTAKEEKNKILGEAAFALEKHKQDLADLKDYYEREILIFKRNVDPISKEKEEISKESDALLKKQDEMVKTESPFIERQSAVLARQFEEKERTMQQKISVLKYANQSYSKDFEAMKKEMEMLRQNYQDIKALAERDNVKIQLESKGSDEHLIFKNISSTITSIGFFEELAARLNTGDLKQIHVDLKKKTTETYGMKARNLNVAILKLINQLDDADIRKQNEEFKRLLKLKNYEIHRIESVFAFADTIRKTRSDFENAVNKVLNETERDLIQFKQSFSGDGALKFQAVIAQINAKYEEIIAMLSTELNRLQRIDSVIRNNISDMPKETNVDKEDAPDVRESLKKINEINRSTRELEIRVVKFRGNKEDKMYLDLNHKLLENIMKVDVIQVNGSEKVREGRKGANKYANKCMEKLEANLES